MLYSQGTAFESSPGLAPSGLILALFRRVLSLSCVVRSFLVYSSLVLPYCVLVCHVLLVLSFPVLPSLFVLSLTYLVLSCQILSLSCVVLSFLVFSSLL